MRTNEELKRLQSLPLAEKVAMTKKYITDWYEHWDGRIYVSFSGGKDSTVLLHLARSVYPDIPAVFCDTGLEFPEVRNHALSVPNVTVLKPEADFREVIKEHGWVFPGKDVALACFTGTYPRLTPYCGQPRSMKPVITGFIDLKTFKRVSTCFEYF